VVRYGVLHGIPVAITVQVFKILLRRRYDEIGSGWSAALLGSPLA